MPRSKSMRLPLCSVSTRHRSTSCQLVPCAGTSWQLVLRMGERFGQRRGFRRPYGEIDDAGIGRRLLHGELLQIGIVESEDMLARQENVEAERIDAAQQIDLTRQAQ